MTITFFCVDFQRFVARLSTGTRRKHFFIKIIQRSYSNIWRIYGESLYLHIISSSPNLPEQKFVAQQIKI